MNNFYNTYIIRILDFKAVKLQGDNLDPTDTKYCTDQAENKLNTDDYFVAYYPVGSQRDIECQKNITSKRNKVDDHIIFSRQLK